MLGLGLRQTKAYKLHNIMGEKFLFRLIQADFGLLKKIRAGNSSRSRLGNILFSLGFQLSVSDPLTSMKFPVTATQPTMQGRFQDLKKECGSAALTNICLANLGDFLKNLAQARPPPPLDLRLQWPLNEDNL